jgi:hypothetical protein
MPICLVVKIQHVALGIQLRRVCAVVTDSIDVGKSFHTKFRIEATSQGIEDLVLFLRAVPYCIIS